MILKKMSSNISLKLAKAIKKLFLHIFSAPVSLQLAPDEPGVFRAPDRIPGHPPGAGGHLAEGMEHGEGDLPRAGVHHDVHR